MNRVRSWWRQPDHYDELNALLQARGVAPLLRRALSGASLAVALIALATIPSTTGPRGVVGVTCTLAAAGAAATVAVLWALSLPTRVQATWYVVICNVTAALAVLAQHSPGAAMLGCTVFSALAAYIALFHAAPLLTYHATVAMVIAAIEAVRIAHQTNVVTALASYAVVLLLNLGLPFGIQTVGSMLGVDAVLAERDELTALLTRRAFHRRAEMRLKQGLDLGGHFVATVIDLDRFKQLNDSHGHRTGDDALASVARALRDTTDDTAVICRSGGEEFVIAEIWPPSEVGGKAQQLCDVIAALPFGITASVGTAGFYPDRWRGESGDLLTELIAAADDAMYVAKRRGGNQTHHHDWPLQAAPDSAENHRTGYGSEGLTA